MKISLAASSVHYYSYLPLQRRLFFTPVCVCVCVFVRRITRKVTELVKLFFKKTVKK